MFKTKKMARIVSSLLVLLMLFSAVLTSCGGGSSTSTVPDTTTTTLVSSDGSSPAQGTSSEDPNSSGSSENQNKNKVIYVNADGYNGPATYDPETGLILGKPEKSGADFIGWYADENYETAITEIPAGTTGTVTVYAKWQAYQLTVSLRSDGQVLEKKTLNFGESYTLPAPDASVKPGYKFAGWMYKDQLFEGASFVFDDDTLFAATFDAVWQANSYTVTFMKGDAVVATEELAFGTAIYKTIEDEAGKSFVGWSVNKDATAADVALTVPASNVTLYAVFTTKQYNVTVIGDREVPGVVAGTYNYGDVITLPEEIVGFECTYQVKTDGFATVTGSYTIGSTYENITDISIYITFIAAKLNITYAGGYTGSGKYEFGDNIIESLPQNSTKTIVGWFYDAAMTQPVMQDDTFDFEHLTYYAKVSTTKNKITLHTASNGNKTVSLGLGETITSVDSKVGYDFVGWEDADGKPVTKMGSVSMDLYPVFTVKHFVLSYDVNDALGTVPESFTADFGSTFVLPSAEELVKPNRNFVAWRYNGKEYAPGQTATVVEGETVIYAIWKGQGVKVDFVDWDSTVIYTYNTEVGVAITIPGNTVIESVSEFDRWEYVNEIGETCVFKNGVTTFNEDTIVRAIYVKSVGGVKTDLIYASPDSFVFIPNKNASGTITSYTISGHVIDEDGTLSDTYVALLPLNLCVPSTYNGLMVTALYEQGASETRGAFNSYRMDRPNVVKFTSIFIPSAIKYLSDYAFYGNGCDVTFGLNSQCTWLGNKVFSCVLSSSGRVERNFYNFPKSIQHIGANAFSVNVAGINAPWNLIDQDGNKIRSLPATVTYIGQSAFLNVGLFDTVFIGKNVTYIGKSAFYGMQSMTSIVIDNDSRLTTIPESCFRSCNGLTSVQIPASLTSIGTLAFADCINLESVDFSACTKLTTIGEMAFLRCGKITELVIPEGVTTIGKGAFTIKIPDLTESSSIYSITKTPSEYEVGALKKVTFPSTLKDIGNFAFAFQSLSSLNLPVSLENIGFGAFMINQNLRSINLSKLTNLTKIGSFAFQKYSDYTAPVGFVLTIPANVTSIGKATFANFSNIKEIKFAGSGTLTYIGSAAFTNISMLSGATVVFPEGLITVDDHAFEYTSLKKISFPVSLQEVSYYAFAHNGSLTDITFISDPNAENLTLGVGAFADCRALTSVTLPCQTAELLGSITLDSPNGTFYDCSALVSIYLEGRNDGKADRGLVIGSGFVTNDSSLKNIYMKRTNVPTIRYGNRETLYSNYLFDGCDVNLVFHVLPDMRSKYLADESWAAIFSTLKRASIVDDATA